MGSSSQQATNPRMRASGGREILQSVKRFIGLGLVGCLAVSAVACSARNASQATDLQQTSSTTATTFTTSTLRIPVTLPVPVLAPEIVEFCRDFRVSSSTIDFLESNTMRAARVDDQLSILVDNFVDSMALMDLSLSTRLLNRIYDYCRNF